MFFDFDELWDESAEEHFIGRWACVGCFGGGKGKPTEYCIRKSHDGQLRLMECSDVELDEWRRAWRPSPGGRRSTSLVFGVLRPKARWMEVRLETVAGWEAGTLRLRLGESQGTIISNFQRSAGSSWSGDVVAYRPGCEPQLECEEESAAAMRSARYIGQELEDEGEFDVARGWKPCMWDLASVSHWRELRQTPRWKRENGLAVLPQVTSACIRRYKARGVTGPLLAIGHWELSFCREGLGRFVEHCGGFVSSANSLNNHTTLPWLYHLVRHPRIVGAVASILDTNDVLLFSSCMFLREPGSYQEHGVGWHEDGVLYERVLSPMTDWVTAFVALTRCEEQNGCLQFVPLNFKTGFSTVSVPNHPMELQAGEISVHSAKVTHRGGANGTNERRDCLALRYISGRVRDQVAVDDPTAQRDWVVPCCGKTSHFNVVPEPSEELGREGIDLRSTIANLRSVRYGTTTFQKPH